MHGRIIELQEDLDGRCSMDEDALFEAIQGDGIDYVDEITGANIVNEEVRCFARTIGTPLENCNTTPYIIFDANIKNTWFKARFEKACEIMLGMTLKDFVDDFKSYELKILIDDKYGYRISINGEYCESLDAFIRFYGTPGKKYYITRVFDYHY